MELFSTFAFVPNCLAQFGKITFYSWQTSKIYENQEKKKRKIERNQKNPLKTIVYSGCNCFEMKNSCVAILLSIMNRYVLFYSKQFEIV